MQHHRSGPASSAALLAFPELAPAEPSRLPAASVPRRRLPAESALPRLGSVRSSIVTFQNMHLHGDLLVNFLRARKRTFIDRLHWDLPSTDGMEYDQYDTPVAHWIVIHEFGEILAGIRLTPTIARCGIYSYMLRDAQKGLLDQIPSDVLFFEAPVSETIWEASRLFIDDDVPAHRRFQVQSVLMETLAKAAQDVGASHVIGIVPAVWSRWLRRLSLDAVPVGPKFSIDGSISQAALFNTARHRN